MEMINQLELKTALQAVRQAAIACRSVQSGITPESLAKKDNSPVTVADYASQAMICRALLGAFPNDPVIGEEGAAELRAASGAAFLDQVVAETGVAGVRATGMEICDWIDHGSASQYSPRFWTLDPIDGTKGFLRREQYAIALALIVNGRIELGVLGCPNLPMTGCPAAAGTLAWAVRGQGAWMVPMDAADSEPRMIRVSDKSSASDMAFCESVESGHSSHDWSGLISQDLGIHREAVRMDSQCKYVAVARGDAELYLRLPTKKGYQERIWDHAAGVLIVCESGGRVTDAHGSALDWTQGASLAANEGIVASHGPFHAEVVAAVQRHAPEGFKRL
jgi:3'(2'), 5'-bisphosphate nucleotidase